MTPVEDYRLGYPQFAALLGSHNSFHIWRRFLRIRSRLLLLKQDEVSSLESQLDRIDQNESHELFLGNSRRDGNTERKDVLMKLDAALSSYGVSFSFRLTQLSTHMAAYCTEPNCCVNLCRCHAR